MTGTSGDRFSASETAPPEDLLELLVVVSRVFFRMRAIGQDAGAVGESGAGNWGLMHSIAQLGPQTVPQLARARPVSRQHIQTIVNGLEEAGFVALKENPAHKRSRLVTLTQSGRAHYAQMTAELVQMIGALPLEVRKVDLKCASEVLESIGKAMGEQLTDL